MFHSNKKLSLNKSNMNAKTNFLVSAGNFVNINIYYIYIFNNPKNIQYSVLCERKSKYKNDVTSCVYLTSMSIDSQWNVIRGMVLRQRYQLVTFYLPSQLLWMDVVYIQNVKAQDKTII